MTVPAPRTAPEARTPRLPSVTVVVCAYTERRLDDVRAALVSLARQTHRPDAVVLVIDHAPGLAQRVRVFTDAPDMPSCGVRVVENRRRRGLSGARNTAVDLLTGAAATDVVAFLDDDAVARPDWLARLLAPYADRRVAAVGGAAAPRWPVSTAGGAPAVLPPELWWVVGCSYPGQVPDGARGTVEVRNLMGCAMSFRLDVLDVAGEFGEDMGRVGTVPLGCEETELCLRLRRAWPAARIVLDPAAVVDHRVTDDRTAWSYLLRRSVAEGLSKAVVARRWGAGDALSAERTYTRHVLPAALARELRSAWRAARAGDGAAARDRLTAAAALPAAVAAAGWGYARGRTARGVAAPAATPAARSAPRQEAA